MNQHHDDKKTALSIRFPYANYKKAIRDQEETLYRLTAQAAPRE